jgi:hypothetical protein
MGGSGGGSSYAGTPDDAARLRDEVRRELEEQERTSEINAVLGDLLAGINSRDVDAVRERLDDVVDALRDLTIDVDRLLFGGSVAKHTYVDGLSDVDALVVINDSSASPANLVEQFAKALRSRLALGDVAAITTGNLAVTINYRDGTQVQLLPAVERDGHTSIASADGSEWRRIRPHKFAEKLTEVNKANSNAVVPTVKLAKSLLQTLPEDSRPSGYHVEAMAVDAFRSYAGRRDRLSMLTHLLQHSARVVLAPTGDITGQSVHVDAWLGPANSGPRRALSAAIERLSSSVGNAQSAEDVARLFQ